MKVTLFCPGPTSTEFLEQAFTDKPGRKYNESVQTTDKRMSAERCGLLMATAIANDCQTNFVGPFPVVALMYISCYYPNLKKLYVFRLQHDKMFYYFFVVEIHFQHLVGARSERIAEDS